MNANPSASSVRAATQPRPRHGPGVKAAPAASRDALRTVAVILQVLGGAVTPTQAAAALAVSLPRYYALELQALEGMADACEPKGPGRRRSPEREFDRLRREKERLERECARQQALARSAQRALGLTVRTTPEPTKTDANGKKVRRRKPTARALKVAKAFEERTAAPVGEADAAASAVTATN